MLWALINQCFITDFPSVRMYCYSSLTSTSNEYTLEFKYDLLSLTWPGFEPGPSCMWVWHSQNVLLRHAQEKRGKDWLIYLKLRSERQQYKKWRKITYATVLQVYQGPCILECPRSYLARAFNPLGPWKTCRSTTYITGKPSLFRIYILNCFEWLTWICFENVFV